MAGEQALENLAFGDDNVGYCIFGVSMLLIGFLCIAVLALHRSKPNYLSLG